MAVNKIICNSQILIDLTQDTVTADKLGYGLTAHDKTGNIITGICSVPLDPISFDFNKGWVNTGGVWTYQNPTKTYSDIYQVEADNSYFYTLGQKVGSRFRVMFTTQDVRLITSGTVAGTSLKHLNNPAAYANGTFNCTQNGYLIISKDNVDVSGIKTYVYNITQAWL